MTFDGSAIEGYSRVQESDMLALPDPNTFEILPWRGDDAPVARMFCDIKHLSEEPFEGDPRYVLQAQPRPRPGEGVHVLRRTGDGVLHLRVAPTSPKPLDHAGFFDLTQLDMVSELRRQTVVTLEAMGIPVEYSFHEIGPSQHEIDLRYTDALTMADNVMTFRLVVKQVAARPRRVRDVHAEADRGRVRIGDAHAPLAVRGRRQRVPRPRRRVRPVEGRQVLHRRPARTTPARSPRSPTRPSTPTSGSIAGYEAPGLRVLGAQQRVGARARAACRRRARRARTRIEFRSPDPACNPYLAFSVMLAAGLKGIEEGYELPREATNNIYEMTARGARRRRHRLAAAEPGRGDRR